jgi:hypothetical protein
VTYVDLAVYDILLTGIQHLHARLRVADVISQLYQTCDGTARCTAATLCQKSGQKITIPTKFGRIDHVYGVCASIVGHRWAGGIIPASYLILGTRHQKKKEIRVAHRTATHGRRTLRLTQG